MLQKEAKARIKINRLLEEAGWRLTDGKEGKTNILLEKHNINWIIDRSKNPTGSPWGEI